MAYSWEEERTGGGMSSTDGKGFESARAAYRSPKPSSTPRSTTKSKPASSGSRSRSSSSSASKPRFAKPKPGATPRPIGLTISTDSTHPIGVICDHTGSMGDWPEIIREKLALFGKEVERYAPKYAISFCFVGDTRCDAHGLQVREFGSGPALDEHLSKLYAEGDGGDTEESYAVAAYYYLHHCDIPNAVKPILMFILDAPDHGSVIPAEIEAYTGDVINKPISIEKIFKQLTAKFRVYVVSAKGRYEDYWTKLVGEQHFIKIDEVRDIVEVLIGIVAGELGEYKDFEMRSSARHSDKPDRVSRVGDSLKSVKETSGKMTSGKGVRAGDEESGGGKSMRSRKLV